MSKIFSITVIILLLLLGCQNPKTVKLDTSKLEKLEEGSEDQGIPISYKAPSLKDGLNALPFKMKLPKNLPFNAKPFQPPMIYDYSYNGKIVSAEFITNSKNNEDKILLKISGFNHEFLEISQEAEKINLINEVTGYYYEKMLNFQSKGYSYTIVYVNDAISEQQHKKEIVNMANQILE
ncbi:hypothetical protein [Pseudoneobacillus rhizosphaerae]|uniref:DUF4367 domain-containing protein n=1 Tax=Pseudoneobacillus rhizosphaerae TaxID=2880968 RepID=A0A9C7L9N2_9BACI|nr:hypothetical protein [Pseudoneobacillus rhizosphaerae]CAG9607023.1 hypothetical protein NEOCIP111885_00711 [Pseudoneobacillus rhizosphaerae]